MIQASHILFLLAFIFYLLSSIAYVSGVVGIRMSSRRASAVTATADTTTTPHHTSQSFARWPQWGFYFVVLGAVVQAAGIATRWIGAGYYPISNMYEFMNFFGWGIMLIFIWLHRQYKMPALGAFIAPIGLFIIAYASVFPREIQPLIPALQSYWLILHVSFAAFGQAAFAVSFGAALMYLLRAQHSEEISPMGQKTLEFTLYCIVALASFVGLALIFKSQGYQVAIPDSAGFYGLPPLIGPAEFEGVLTEWLGISLPLLKTPRWMGGLNAAQNWNTIVISVLAGALAYALLRLAFRKPLRAKFGRWVHSLDPDVLDDISYRAIAIGFPLFTLGGLLFAMIWAQEAWGRFWGWDPKEVWALIMWLTYSGYLHLRMTRGWRGAKAAWLAVIGFVVVLFTLLGVNLLVVGLHSYAV